MKSLLPLLMFLFLAACEQLGIPDPAKDAAIKEADGKAIGGACRHAGRALEDCYTLNPGGHKAAIFAGWKEMNDYMAENKIETVKPELPTMSAQPKSRAKAEAEAEAEPDAAASEAESAPAKTRASSRRRPKVDTAEH